MNKIKILLLAVMMPVCALSVNAGEQAEEVSAPEPTPVGFLKQGHSAFATVGPGFISSDMKLGWSKGNPAVGCDWEIGYSWISRKKIGAGFLYRGYQSWGSYVPGKLNGSFAIHYFAPQFTGNFGPGSSRFSFNWTFGLGFTYMEDKTRGSVNGISFDESHAVVCKSMNYGIGMQYGITRHISALLNLTLNYVFTKRSEFYDSNDISWYSYSLGVKYTF